MTEVCVCQFCQIMFVINNIVRLTTMSVIYRLFVNIKCNQLFSQSIWTMNVSWRIICYVRRALWRGRYLGNDSRAAWATVHITTGNAAIDIACWSTLPDVQEAHVTRVKPVIYYATAISLPTKCFENFSTPKCNSRAFVCVGSFLACNNILRANSICILPFL